MPKAFETALHDQSKLHSSAELHAARTSILHKAASSNNNKAKHVLDMAAAHMESHAHVLAFC